MSEIEDEILDILLIPNDLFSFIVEKMDYFAFSNFNRCSKFSSAMCDSFPAGVYQHVYFSSIEVQNDGEIYVGEKELPVEEVPQNVLIEVGTFTAYVNSHESVLQFVRNHRISADEVLLEYLDHETEYIKNLMEIMKPRRFGCVPCNEDILKIQEVREVREIWTGEDDSSEDEVLLGLAASKMLIHGTFSTDGVTKLIQQWNAGERAIEQIQLCYVEHFDVEEIKSKLQPDIAFQYPADLNSLYLCKSIDHTACLKMEFDKEEPRCEVDISVTSEEDFCPKRQRSKKRKHSLTF